MAISSYSIARALLKEKYALNAKTTQEALLDSRTCLRYFPGIPMGKVSECLDCLRTIASVKNTKASHTVLNPEVNKEELPGTWRHVQEYAEPPRAKTEPDVQDVYQLLKLGWLETLVGSDNKVDFSEARIREGRFLQDQPTGDDKSDDEKYLEVFWPSCSNAKLKTMVGQLGASTFTDPTIAGEKQAGIWRNNLVVPKAADDGSNVITMFLGIAHFRLDGFATWLTHRTENIAYLWGYSKDEAQAIGVAWKAKGRSARFQYNKSTGLVDIVLSKRAYDPLTIAAATGSWDCRYKEIVDSYYGVEDPTLYPLTTTPADGVSYNRRVVDNGDGSWDIIVTTKNVQYRDVAFQTSGISAGATVTTRKQLGLTTQTQEPMTSVTGAVLKQRVDVRDDCSKDVTTDKEVPINQTETGESHSHAADSTQKIDTEMTVVNYDALDKTAEAASGDAAPAWDEEDTYALEAIVRSGTFYWASLKASNLNHEPTTGDTWWVKTVPPSAGSIRDVSAVPTEAGNVRVQDRTTTPVNQTEEGESHSAASDSTEEINTELAKVDYDALDKDAEDFTIRNIRATPTEAGNVRVQDRVVTPVNQTETGEAHSAAADSTDEINTELAKTDYDALDKTAAVGTIRDVRAAPTEAGNVRVQDSVATPIDQTSTGGGDSSGARSSTITVHTEGSDVVTTGGGSGKIVRGTSTPTEAGNHRTALETTTVTDQTASGGEDSLARGVATTIHTENEDTPEVGSAGSGTIKRLSSTPTEAGRLRTEETVITPKARTLTEGNADAFKTSENTIKTQETTQEAVPTAVAGQVITVRNVPTDTGFRTEKNIATAVAEDSGEFISSYTDDTVVTKQKFRNAAALTAATDGAASGIDNTVDGNINEFKKYDYIKTSVQSRVPQSCPSAATWITYSEWKWQVVHGNYAGQVAERSFIWYHQQYREKYDHTLFFYLTAAAAAAAISGFDSSSSISRAGNHLWQAHKIVVTYETQATTTLAAPKFNVIASGRSVPAKA